MRAVEFSSTALTLWVGAVFLIGSPPGRAAEPRELRAAADRAFVQQLETLAARCGELNLDEQAAITRGWFIPRYAGRDYLFLPSSAAAPQHEPANPPTAIDYWQQHFWAARRAQAERLYALALETAEAQPEFAYSLLYEALHEDPDHAESRQRLGYRRVDDQWRRAGDQVHSAVGRSPLPEYGFAARGYHQLTTPHFRLLTNGDQDQARAIAQRLEDVYAVWQQLFYGYWSDASTLARRLENGTSDYRPRGDKHRVVWFATRQQYLDALQRSEPRIEKTLGIYLDRQRTAYFYGDPSEMQANWVHEITHQLFSESLRTAPRVAERQNLWIVEGIALYLESLVWHDGYVTLGGYDADRLQYARYRALNDKFYVPWAEFVRLGREAVQRDPNIGALYSQAAGVTHFLMNTPRQRSATVKLLSAVYAGRDEPEMLAALLETDFSELDREYADFLVLDDEDLVPGPPVVNLYLGHCRVTDAGLERVALERLEWLDVGFTAVGDTAVARLASAPQLRRLTLENSAVTGAGLRAFRNLRGLEYLDLSGLPISDEQLTTIGELTSLESLWLTGTQITDAGLSALQGLKRLRTLDVSGTAVTPAGLAALREHLPQLGVPEATSVEP